MNNGFKIRNGILVKYTGDKEKIVIPDSVVEIGERAFDSTYNITEVTMPDSIVNIGERAFSFCFKLEKIHFSKNLESIGSYAFEDCERLKEVHLPDTLKELGFCSFMDCKELELVTMPGDIENGRSAFTGCNKLADENGFFVHNGVAYAYYGENAVVNVPEGTKIIKHGLFSHYNNEGSANIRKVILPEGLEKIEGNAFAGCKFLEEISIPKTVHTIGDNAFSGCTMLKRFEIPDTVENMGDRIFRGCRGFADENGFVIVNNTIYDYYGTEKNIEIPEGIEIISENAFYGCAVTTIKLPSTVVKIGSRAFEGCKELEKINMPPTLLSIGEHAFYDCTMLENIVIPSGVKKIKWGTFGNCTNLRKLVLSEGLEEINDWSVANCTKLKTIEIPSTVRKIDEYAFADCKALNKVIFHSKDVNMDSSAFEDCPKLKDEKGFTIINTVLYEYKGKDKDVIVPEGVTEIAEGVFREGEKRVYHGVVYREKGSLNKITLPSTLRKIGDEAFYGCCQLSSIRIPSGVTYIGNDALVACTNLNNITVDNENAAYSSVDGILMDKAEESILLVPAGKKLTEYCIPSNVKTIGRHAFIDCESLKKIMIPATVENVGDEAFPRNVIDIEVDPKAGSGTIGTNVFDIFEYGKPIVYPKLPVTFVREGRIQVSLALGFCLNTEQYDGEYARLYEKYAAYHQRTLTKKAAALNLKGIDEYFLKDKQKNASSNKIAGSEGEALDNGYKPDLSIKKPSELRKVELLEEVIQKGSLKDVADVLETYQTFEMTARALGMAARYRGVEFVKLLIKHGATFEYSREGTLQKKYKMYQDTTSGTYSTEYYLMVVPEKLKEKYRYSAMNGVSHMNIFSDMVPLSLDQRIEVVKYLAASKRVKISLDEMLFFALTEGELNFADALIEMGVNLRKKPPVYYKSNHDTWTIRHTYINIITLAPNTIYWHSYVASIVSLKESCVLPVLERFVKLASAIGKKLIISPKMLYEVEWNEESLSYVMKNTELPNVSKKKVMENAISRNSTGSLKAMVENGWLGNVAKLDGLIDFARNNKCTDALVWLMDYKNKTVDVEKEEAKKEAKMMKEFMENPNSVAALKRKWSYKKLSDGTLQITSYKGDEEEVYVPSVIGRAKVTSIGAESFSACKFPVKNGNSRRKIKNIIIPEGVKEIGKEAFRLCESLQEIIIPNTVKKIDSYAFGECMSLRDVYLPDTIEEIDDKLFGGYTQIHIHTPAGSVAEKYIKENYSEFMILNDYTGMQEKD